ncbi:hypothetical protein Tco_1224376 [Tanacetum coccineum]
MSAMAASEPPSSSCRRSVQQNQPVTHPYHAFDSRDVTHRLLANSTNTVVVKTEAVDQRLTIGWCNTPKITSTQRNTTWGATS